MKTIISLAFICSLIFAPLATAQTTSYGQLAPGLRAGFASVVLIDGEDVLVGRTAESMMFPEPPMHTGGVHVFGNTDEGWSEKQLVQASDGELGDLFGFRLVLSGDVLAISAPKADEGRGAIYVFGRTADGMWSESARLALPESQPGDSLGWGLALDGDLLVAGAPGSGGKGTAVVYRRDADANDWAMVGTLDSPAGAHAKFGSSVAIFHNHAVAGASHDNGGMGSAYVFGIDGEPSEWELHHKIAPEDSSHLFFGAHMTMSGQDLIVGAVRGAQDVVSLSFGGAGRVQTGAVYYYRHSRDGWEEVVALRPEDETASQSQTMFFGTAAALAPDGRIWVGAPMDMGVGAAYVYGPADDGTGWAVEQTLTVSGIPPGASFGSSLAVSENLAVVGATRADFGDGRAYIHRRDEESGEWMDEGHVTDSGLGLTSITGDTVRCTDGEAAEFGCMQVDLLSFLPNSAVGAEQGVIVNDLWGWTDPETGHEIAIVGRSDGTVFIDVTDPHNPLYLGQLLATEGSLPNAWRDPKVYADHAFIVADNVGQHGMQVFDLRRLRNVENPPVTFEVDALYDKVASAHNVVINEETGFAYIVAASGGGETCGGGLHMVDVRDPLKPTFAGCFHDPTTGIGGRGATHDGQCVIYRGPDKQYQGREICFGANETALSIADVTDKKSPVAVAVVAYPSVGYTHQGWLTEDHKYFYMDDEGDELFHGLDRTRTMIYDVSDLDDPILAAEFLGTNGASDHNLYIKGDLMYQSNYVSGLRVIDISDRLHPKEVAAFDTVPWGENIAGFAGSWSNYPYFKSGNIVVTSVREGVFVVRKTDEPLP
jgi:choice-of-anchor B domain-containing protein